MMHFVTATFTQTFWANREVEIYAKKQKKKKNQNRYLEPELKPNLGSITVKNSLRMLTHFFLSYLVSPCYKENILARSLKVCTSFALS